MKFVDSHAHLFDEKFENVKEVIERAKAGGICVVVNAGDSVATSEKAVCLAEECDIIYAAVGLHPENVNQFIVATSSKLKKLAKHEKVVAIGEIGLDYHWKNDEETKKMQKIVFEKQIELANELNLPIVVHCRDAVGDTLEILKRTPPKRPSLMHCYGGSLDSAQEFMKLGFSFSFGGVVTFKNAKNVKEVVKNLPLERILLETDCPYLAPEPFRGQINEPKNVVYVADEIARLKGLTLEEVAKVTTNNSMELFKL